MTSRCHVRDVRRVAPVISINSSLNDACVMVEIPTRRTHPTEAATTYRPTLCSPEDAICPTPSPWMRIAEARLAIQYLERAENWAGELDEEILADMVMIH